MPNAKPAQEAAEDSELKMQLPLIEAFKKDLYHCSDCNYCVDAVWEERGIDHVCPTMQHHTRVTSYSGRGYITAARAWREGAALDLAALGARVFTCTTCGNCETVCPIGLRPTHVARALRGELWAQDAVPASARTLHTRMLEDGNPNGVPRGARMAWAEDLAATTHGNAAVMYLPGCAAATAQAAEARAVHALLSAAGYQVQTLGEQDSCCGAPLYELGLEEEANFMQAALRSKLKDTLPIIASGLECMQQWTRHGAAPISFAAWLLNALKSKQLKLMPRTDSTHRVQVLDSCQSRNDADPGGAVREILALLQIECSAPQSAARYVVCCGAGGGMPTMQPEAAARMASARTNAVEVAATAMVGADSRCVAHLKKSNASALPIFSLAEFVHQAFRAP